MVSRSRISRTSVSLLASLLFLPTALFADAPTSVQYQRLEEALQLYLHIAESGGWPSLPAGPTIRPGADDPRIATLARRLAITGDLANDGHEFTGYDGELQAAVARFQLRHGLEPDALVGKATLRALNVSAEERVAQLRRNLEPTAQLFAAPPAAFLLVNIPAFEVYLYRDATRVWSGRVVVGEPDTETPLFESAIGFIVLNPTWTVPYSIASEEMLPKIRANPAFLERGGYELRDPNGSPLDPADVDWTQLSRNHFPYTLVQRAGPGNQMGRVKFLFPNEHGVCMHDTDKRQLFAVDLRALSHGCIRVDRPVELAATLLAAEGWTRSQVDAELDTGQTVTIELAEPMPFISAYLTAAVDESGTVFFYPDIYGLLGND